MDIAARMQLVDYIVEYNREIFSRMYLVGVSASRSRGQTSIRRVKLAPLDLSANDSGKQPANSRPIPRQMA